jgi:hypothetical protein
MTGSWHMKDDFVRFCRYVEVGTWMTGLAACLFPRRFP